MGLGARSDWSLWVIAVLVFFSTLAFLFLKSWWSNKQKERNLASQRGIGDITLPELEKYCGVDPFLPILLAVRGNVYDVSKGKDFYGPGGGYSCFAGKEVARALAVMSLKEEDCTGNLEGLSEEQLKVLQDWEDKFHVKYPTVGRLVALKDLTIEELRKYDGSSPDLPIYLSLKGTVFDVTRGKQFYGPEGIYPFAGRECARAFALMSTDTQDCTADLDGLHTMELDALRDWQAKFYSKYKVVGRVMTK